MDAGDLGAAVEHDADQLLLWIEAGHVTPEAEGQAFPLIASVTRSSASTRRVGLSQPAASQHLRILRDAGLVTVRIEEPRRLYRVDPVGLGRLQAELADFWKPALEMLTTAVEAGDWP